ncbi:speckle-type POZ protein B [Caerostris darwini]|uniref:Speckle-type POZ protein B n=1 Tax=Caerostris darwini TaxID=1538125 RepID=A0AAV4TZF6_9ARAC|nr:speckle-type POZ protein B [Caerostris darwini]
MASKSISRRNAFSITWIIENFDHCWPREKAIHSPTFVVALMESTKWHLVIYPWNNGYVSFYIARLADCEGPENIEVNFQLEFLSSDGSTLKFKNRENCSFSKDKSFGMDEFATTKEVFEINEHDFLPHGNLTARCTTWKSIGEIYKNVACLARTIIGVKRRSALWEIDHDSFKEWKTKNHNQMKSAFEDDINLSMIFDLRKGLGNREEIYIELVPNFSDSIYMTCKGSLMDATGNIIECKETKFHFNDMFKTRRTGLVLRVESLLPKGSVFEPDLSR